MSRSLRLLTLNIHGEPGGRDKKTLSELLRFILRERPDVVALQEVCQTREAPLLTYRPIGYSAAEPGASLREDLFVLHLTRMLCERGERYTWSYLPIKLGYGKYDEGVALLSREPMRDLTALTVSKRDDDLDFRTRRLLGARIGRDFFYSVHFGRFDDPIEPFFDQWQRALLGFRRHGGGRIWLLGDFNAPAEDGGGGYDLVRKSGFFDAWQLPNDGHGATAVGGIDGWGDKGRRGIRIDQIWSSAPLCHGSARRVFDGRDGEVVSDHFGILIEHIGG